MTQRELYERLKDEVFQTLFKLSNGEASTRDTVKPIKNEADELYQLTGCELDYDGTFFLEPEEVADYVKQYKHFADELYEAVSALTLMLVDMGFSELEVCE